MDFESWQNRTTDYSVQGKWHQQSKAKHCPSWEETHVPAAELGCCLPTLRALYSSRLLRATDAASEFTVADYKLLSGTSSDRHQTVLWQKCFPETRLKGETRGPQPWAMDRQWSTACQEPGCAAGGERQVSQRRFICIYRHSPSLILPLELCLPPDKQGHNKCKALESPPNHPPPPTSSSWKNCHPWNWSLVPKWLGATGIKNKMVEEKLGSHFHALLNINNIMYCDFSWSKVMLLINLDSQRET